MMLPVVVAAAALRPTSEQPVPSSLQEKGVTCSLLDAEGYWWYGGKGTGLCRYDGHETEAFRSDRQHPDLLRSNDVLCMAEQRERAEIWFGTREGAYILSKQDYSLRPVVLKTREAANELADKRVSCMLTATDGSLWLSFRNQLLHFSAEAALLERFATQWDGRNRSVSKLCEAADGTLWAGLWNGGVIRLKKVDGTWKKEERSWDDYPADTSEPLSAARQKQMLDSVMLRLAPRHDAAVLSWAAYAPDCYFVGTYHSLYRYDGRQVTLLQGDLDKVRSMAYAGRRQTLYLLSKERGICQFNLQPAAFKVLLDSLQFRQLQLQGDTALLLSRGVEGVSMLNLRTSQLTADTTTADVKPVATVCAIDGNKLLLTYRQQMLSLPKDMDLLEVHLSTLDFDHASQIQFAYRLNDYGEWTVLPEGEHVAKLARLPAGISLLQVRATDNLGRWSIPVTVLTLERPMRWYQHAGLWVSVVVVLLGAGYYIVSRKRSGRQPENAPSAPEASSVSEAPEPSLSVAEQDFLAKAAAAVSAHMTDSDYSVDALASDLCMSRANLHRKMRTIAGQTPTDFIRNLRLERAAHLLRTTSHTVNEIADLVGFSYASYFTKCFKDKYGVLPKDY